MFGFDPRQFLRGPSRGAPQGKPGKMQRDEDMIQRRDDIIGEAPRQLPRWAQALQGVGATMQDMQTAQNGGQGTAVSRFAQAQEQMRQARQQHDQRRRRFEQLSRNISPSDQQFWNAFALGGEEAAMQVLNSRSERKYDSQVRNDDRAFRREERVAGQEFTAGQNQADRGFRRSESAADRAFRGREGALDRSTRIYEGNADRDLRRSEGAADRAAQMEARLNTAVVANARAATGLGPNEPLTPEARALVRQQIDTNDVSTSDMILLAQLGYISEEDVQRRINGGSRSGGDEIDAVVGALGSQ